MRIIFCVLISFPALALQIPWTGHLDRRIQFVNYNPHDVVKIVGHFGFVTNIHLQGGEEVKNISMGDSDAWMVTPVHNNIFLKPVGDRAITNMTVVTNKRVYSFALSAHWSHHGDHPRDMTFELEFKYPMEEAKKQFAKQKAEELEKKLAVPNHPKASNWNYWLAGSEDVKPSEVFDDGRFTYMTFSNNMEMPAIYIVKPNGKESLVNTSVQGDTIVIHSIRGKFVLRRGAAVACLLNKQHDKKGVSNPEKTSIKHVERFVKGDV